MRRRNVVLSIVLAPVVTVAVVAGVYLYWHLASRVMIGRAKPAPAPSARAAIWRDPGAVERLDFRAGPGGPDGAPVPPFRFVEEDDDDALSPKVTVEDARGRTWKIKWGDEVQAETFAVRLAWAAGYFVEPAYFVPSGTIENVPRLAHAGTRVGEGGAFADARFELKEKGARKRDEENGWAWNDNPFVGTRELAGLKVVTMLVSNWDTKDVRDVARGSNTAVVDVALAGGETESRYLVTAWGGSMGRWGTVLGRGKWDCAGFEAETPDLVTGVVDGVVQWGYTGQRTADVAAGIRVEDVRWIHGYLGRITDAQLRDGLLASGATEAEADCFARALRARIDRLGAVGVEPPEARAERAPGGVADRYRPPVKRTLPLMLEIEIGIPPAPSRPR